MTRIGPLRLVSLLIITACSWTLCQAASITIQSPKAHQVVQRDGLNLAEVHVVGFCTTTITRAEARVVPMAGFSGYTTKWQLIDDSPAGTLFDGYITVPAGWYELQVRTWHGTTPVAETSLFEFGVGDVYITAGQSNAANAGEVQIDPEDRRVSATSMTVWQVANDPQPIATGGGGSPWPAMGDALVDMYDVPVGLLSVAVSGTKVNQWIPDAPGTSYYPRIRDAVQHLGPHGFKAILWHQGESDAYSNTTAPYYASLLQSIIDQSRIDAGFDVPWGVAIASYGPGLAQSRIDEIAAGQQMVIAGDELVFLGANTNELLGSYRASDGIHMSQLGLMEHGQRWAQAIAAYTFTQGPQLAYEATDLGDGVTGYRFWITNDRPAAGSYAVSLAFQGHGDATVQQMQVILPVNTESAANATEGFGTPPYQKDHDSWAYDGWSTVLGTSIEDGTLFTGYREGTNLYEIALLSPQGAGDGINVAYIVADGALDWSGSLTWSGKIYPLSGIAKLPGDYTYDGKVDTADYTTWADSFNDFGHNLLADGNGNGMVDTADYTIWADHFGLGQPQAATVQASSSLTPASGEAPASSDKPARRAIRASSRRGKIMQAVRQRLRDRLRQKSAR